jgi:hypothetical protein
VCGGLGPARGARAIYRRGYSSFLRVSVGIVGDVELAADILAAARALRRVAGG